MGTKEAGKAKERVVKFVTAPVAGSNQKEKGSEWTADGVVQPELDPKLLTAVASQSGVLQTIIGSYRNNIDGLGHALYPVVDASSKRGVEAVREAVYADKLYEWMQLYPNGTDSEGKPVAPPEEPTDAEVDVQSERLRGVVRRESIIGAAFFASCCSEQSFVSLRKDLRMDYEITGNAYVEVIRNAIGRLARLKHMNPVNVRMTRHTGESVEVNERRMVSPIRYESVKRSRRFRKYVMNDGQNVVWFREFGDPRCMSAMTGKWYADSKLFESDRNKPAGDTLATEVLHLKQYFTGYEYGAPRWMGEIPRVVGSRAADETNQRFFTERTIPAMLITIAGSQSGDTSDMVHRLNDFFQDQVKGTKAFNKVAIIEAPMVESLDGSTRTPAINVTKLSDHVQNEASFLKYSEQCADAVGATFRVPKLLRGIVNDVNRASAFASILFAEGQVFGPERKDFDWVMTEKILPEIGVFNMKFWSNAAQISDPTELAALLLDGVKAGVVMPNEAREEVGPLMDTNLPKIEEFWAEQPMDVTKLGLFPSKGGELPVASDEVKRAIESAVERVKVKRVEAMTRGIKGGGNEAV